MADIAHIHIVFASSGALPWGMGQNILSA